MLIKRTNLLGIKQIVDKLKSKTFDINTQYKFLKIIKKIEEEINILQEQTQMIADKYGEQEKTTGYVKIKTEYLDECKKKLDEINNYEVQLPDIYFSLDELKDLELSLDDLSLLDKFIK